MLRGPVSNALRACRRLTASGVNVAGKAIVSAWTSERRAGDSREGMSTALVLAAVAATGIACKIETNLHAFRSTLFASFAYWAVDPATAAITPANAEARDDVKSSASSLRLAPRIGAARVASGDDDLSHEGDQSMGYKNAAERPAPGASDKGASADPVSGAKAKGGVSAAGGTSDNTRVPSSETSKDENGDEVFGLQASVALLRQALKTFRQSQSDAGKVWTPIDLRLEEGDERATLSATFFVPRTANILKVVSAMLNREQSTDGKQPVMDTKDSAYISFCHKDGKGSLLLQQGRAGNVSATGHATSRDTVHLYRDGGFTKRDIAGIVKGYKEAWAGDTGMEFPPRSSSSNIKHSGPWPATSKGKTAGHEKLKELGVMVYDKTAGDAPGWASLAGYAEVKQEIEDTLVLPLVHPEVFDAIAKKTRERFESNRPRAVLFEGPPGTGKTLSARIIAGRSDRPMVHVPVESVMSKWYGDSENKLSSIFDACDEMGGAIIFIDEVDAMVGSRNSNMHEATRRILSVILQKVEGFEKGSKNILICATNRSNDLDKALLSRFQLSIRFGLPDPSTRQEVFALYAKHLSADDLETLATITSGMSCRDIKETCQHAERRWASKLVRGEVKDEIPTLEEYVGCVDKRSENGSWTSKLAQA